MQLSRLVLVGASGALVAAMGGAIADAHKPITSKYSYNEHVFPIARDRCGSCHRTGGIAPMSLLTYEDAYPWAQAIKEEVVGLRMPPSQAEEGFGSFRNAHALTSRELDVLVEWCNGGTPEGDAAPPPSEATPEAGGWPLGEPDLLLAMPSNHTLGEDVSEETRFFVLPTGTDVDRWIRAIDFRPDGASIVRTAAVFVDTASRGRRLDDGDDAPGFSSAGDAGFAADEILALWLPGQAPVTPGEGLAYRLPAGADLVLRIHYKKNWNDEGTAITDQSAVGLYLTDASEPEAIQALVVSAPGGDAATRDITFDYAVEQNIDVVALLPQLSATATQVQVDVVRPDGAREPMLLLSRPSPEWETQYWLEHPLTLPEGSRVEVRATFPDAPSTTTDAAERETTVPIRLRLDYVPVGRVARSNPRVR